MRLNGKIIVVTGSNGFIGGHLIDALLKEKPKKIIKIDKDTGQNLLDFQQIAKMFSKEKPDIVFNLAVLPLPASLTAPLNTTVEILYMMINLCEMARLKLFKRLVHISSSEVYGNAIFKPQDENHPLNPRTPYASAKASCDLIALSYQKTFGIDVVIPRCFNTYGPRQPVKWKALIPNIIDCILNNRPPLIFRGGKRTRDFTYVTDTAQGIIGVAKHAESGEVVNIGSGNEIAIEYILEKICKMMDYKGKINYQDERAGDVSQLVCDNDKAVLMFNFSPKIELEEGLRRTIDYYTKLHNTKAVRP